MTSLTITPNAENKKLAISGIVAVGEPVAVTIKGFAGVSVTDLHLRVILQGHVVATFPMRHDDEWAERGEDLACILDLNTDLARMMCRAPENCCLFTLEDTGRSDPDTRRLWAVGEHELRGWPADGVAARPYPLSKVPSLIQTWEAWISEWRTEVDNLDITAAQTATGCRIVITRKNGEEIAVFLTNGQDGQPGADGTSAAITVGQVSTLPAGSQATVENVGTSTEAVLNFGIPKGDKGIDGADGEDGVGVPAGGTQGQVLAKKSGTDFDTEWVNPQGGSITLDDAVTQSSANGVKSSGIWSFVKGLIGNLTGTVAEALAGKASSVNGISPDEGGSVELTGADIPYIGEVSVSGKLSNLTIAVGDAESAAGDAYQAAESAQATADSKIDSEEATSIAVAEVEQGIDRYDSTVVHPALEVKLDADKVFDGDEISDDFATNLLGKQVAISAVQEIVNDMFDNGETEEF